MSSDANRTDLEPSAENGALTMERLEEFRQSLRIIRQAVDGMPDGPVMGKVPRLIKPKAGETYHAIESPKGELGYFIVSDGRSFFINCRYSEEQDYFTLRTASVPSQGLRMVSSEAISTGEVEPDWLSILNHTTCALGAESKCCS